MPDKILKGNWKRHSNPFKNKIREYKDVWITVVNNKNYIVKKVSDVEKKLFGKMNDYNSILVPIDIDNDFAIFEYLNTPDSEYCCDKYNIQCIEAMADIHHFSRIEDYDFLKLRNKSYYENLIEKVVIASKNKKINISKDGIALLWDSIGMLDKNYSLVHDDFFSFNTLKSKKWD